jgi:hypothetical protein
MRQPSPKAILSNSFSAQSTKPQPLALSRSLFHPPLKTPVLPLTLTPTMPPLTSISLTARPTLLSSWCPLPCTDLFSTLLPSSELTERRGIASTACLQVALLSGYIKALLFIHSLVTLKLTLPLSGTQKSYTENNLFFCIFLYFYCWLFRCMFRADIEFESR